MSAPADILLVEDERHVRLAGKQTLELAGYSVEAFESAPAALERLSRDWPGIVVSDVRMPGMSGLELMRACRELDRDLPVILVTGHGDISMAVEAIRDGAYDFIEKPFRAEMLVDVVKRALEKRSLVLENRALRSELDAHGEPEVRIIGRTPAMERVRAAIDDVADTNADVLIIGETGTGKELVARALHQKSGRRGRHFVAINCGALPESIIESELFGHEAGAFTGAKERRIGKFEHADGGTLFLDEIESMPVSLQVRLLRVLQERTVERLGSNLPVSVDVRVIAATKSDLKALAAKGEFREDLYYRLDVIEIALPPLRERRDDIPYLFQHFALTAAARYQREPPPASAELMRRLMAQDWPGNVRELQNAAERFVLSPTALGGGVKESDAGSAGRTLAEEVRCFERALIHQALREHGGNVSEACAALGVPRKTFYEKMQKHGLRRRDHLET
jgi:two-component system C4-dicarboxylate transport response regulator DctD